jgi:ATP-dependent RNA helicase DeaD
MKETTAAVETDGFTGLGLDPALLRSLEELGYEEPTPVQREAIPIMLAGRDMLGQAATGTGKTAAFALPMLQRIAATRTTGPRSGVPRALVLVPTRELAMQVAEALHKYGRGLDMHVLPVYGGQPIQQQLRALKRGVDVVVATPGRALDHVRRGSLALEAVEIVVLDEADEMLDMGFADDLEAILSELPAERQTALFSATIPPRIAHLAEKHLRKPARLRIAAEKSAPGEAPRVRQVAYVVGRRHKIPALRRVLEMESPTSAMVFCRTRTEVDELTESLASGGYRAEALHGGNSQEQRDRVMRRFRENAIDVLVATDVAARGLDIDHVSHVVNFDVPSAPGAYVHRIGRTGRAGREGVAITLVEPREHRFLRSIEQATGQRIQVESVPTVVDLRARRLDVTQASLRELLVGEDLDEMRVVVESLAEEFDVLDIAAAAVKLAHQSTATGGEEADIPEVSAPAPERSKSRSDRTSKKTERTERPTRARRRAGAEDVTRLYIGLGRKAGIRPADIVGAIANETGIDAKTIGSIQIADRFTLVEVPGAEAEQIIGALSGTSIRGKRMTVRRDRG